MAMQKSGSPPMRNSSVNGSHGGAKVKPTVTPTMQKAEPAMPTSRGAAPKPTSPPARNSGSGGMAQSVKGFTDTSYK